jgi:hypothetical protein
VEVKIRTALRRFGAYGIIIKRGEACGGNISAKP